MSKQKTTENSNIDAVVENTWAFKTIQAYKDVAREAGLVLTYDPQSSTRDFPDDAVGQLERLKKLQTIGQLEAVAKRIIRQSVTVTKDGKHVTKEYLTYGGEFTTHNFRNEPYGMEFEIGKYNKPRTVINPDQKWNKDTGQTMLPEKVLVGQETIYWIEINDKNRKQIIDQVIGDNDPESIQYYFKMLSSDGMVSRRDATFNYSDMVSYSISELRTISASTGGSKSPGYYRDKDGKLHDRDGNLIQ